MILWLVQCILENNSQGWKIVQKKEQFAEKRWNFEDNCQSKGILIQYTTKLERGITLPFYFRNAHTILWKRPHIVKKQAIANNCKLTSLLYFINQLRPEIETFFFCCFCPATAIKYLDDCYLVNKPLQAAGVSADNVRGWEIVWKMNIWPRSEASRANVKFWGQSEIETFFFCYFINQLRPEIETFFFCCFCPATAIKYLDDCYLVNKPLQAAGVSADNVRGWEIVWKMNIWPRSEASRANVKFWGQSFSQGHYQPTYQKARKGFIYFI